ncbi:aspartate/glutamate racemase family protein [Wukongibacter baidiensis]|uniref:aspartate/glutamate racemase family protein n=1 Tax=Wukongibacter baidiensis TaxID=1723361 RepID=UPI003D7F1F9D
MNILIINPNTSESVTEEIEIIASKAASKETKLEVISAPFGSRAIQSYVDEAVAHIAVIEELIKRKGTYDAAVIACAADPGLQAARELLDVPVVGIAEAAYHSACLLGYRFSAIGTGGPEEISLTLETIRKYGLEIRCASVKALGIGVLGVQDDTIDLLEMTVKEAINNDGANVVCFGCAALAGLGEELSKRVGIPVVDGVTQGVLMAEMMAKQGWNRTIPKRNHVKSSFKGKVQVNEILKLYSI